MKHLIVTLVTWLLAVSIFAQVRLTDELRGQVAGQGVVTIQQSTDIERLVNGEIVCPSTTTKPTTTTVASTASKSKNLKEKAAEGNSVDSTKRAVVRTPRTTWETASHGRHKAKGYRICIFTGGNSRVDKTKAVQMGQTCRAKFPELSVYTSFQPPRWVTHVGDFKSVQDAKKYVTLIRKARFTYEVRIVGSEVNLRDRY